jgi:DNA-binding transcriptional ArsR family regulator
MVSRKQLKTRNKKSGGSSRFAYDGLNRVIHERARVSVLTSLITHSKGLAFSELKQLCALTDGNLNRHLLVLEEAKLVSVSKTFDGARTQTRCRITALGRRRYLEYLAVLEQVVADGAAAARYDAAGTNGPDPANA